MRANVEMFRDHSAEVYAIIQSRSPLVGTDRKNLELQAGS